MSSPVAIEADAIEGASATSASNVESAEIHQSASNAVIRLGSSTYSPELVQRIFSLATWPEYGDGDQPKMGQWNTEKVLQKAAEWNLHPQSVIGLARIVYARWKNGQTHIDVSLEETHFDDKGQIGHREQLAMRMPIGVHAPPYDAAIHPEKPIAVKEFYAQDQFNYVVCPLATKHVLQFHTHGSQRTPAELDAFQAAVSDVPAIDVAWFERFAWTIRSHTSAMLAMQVCLWVAHYFRLHFTPGTPLIEFQFVREDRKMPLTILVSSQWHLDGAALEKHAKTLRPEKHKYVTPIRPCAECKTNISNEFCTFCRAYLWCSVACFEKHVHKHLSESEPCRAALQRASDSGSKKKDETAAQL